MRLPQGKSPVPSRRHFEPENLSWNCLDGAGQREVGKDRPVACGVGCEILSCYQGRHRHPVMVALDDTIARFEHPAPGRFLPGQVLKEPAFEDRDGRTEVIAEGDEQVNIVEVLCAGEAVREIISRVDGGPQFAAAWAEEAEVAIAVFWLALSPSALRATNRARSLALGMPDRGVVRVVTV